MTPARQHAMNSLLRPVGPNSVGRTGTDEDGWTRNTSSARSLTPDTTNGTGGCTWTILSGCPGQGDPGEQCRVVQPARQDGPGITRKNRARTNHHIGFASGPDHYKTHGTGLKPPLLFRSRGAYQQFHVGMVCLVPSSEVGASSVWNRHPSPSLQRPLKVRLSWWCSVKNP